MIFKVDFYKSVDEDGQEKWLGVVERCPIQITACTVTEVVGRVKAVLVDVVSQEANLLAFTSDYDKDDEWGYVFSETFDIKESDSNSEDGDNSVRIRINPRLNQNSTNLADFVGLRCDAENTCHLYDNEFDDVYTFLGETNDAYVLKHETNQEYNRTLFLSKMDTELKFLEENNN